MGQVSPVIPEFGIGALQFCQCSGLPRNIWFLEAATINSLLGRVDRAGAADLCMFVVELEHTPSLELCRVDLLSGEHSSQRIIPQRNQDLRVIPCLVLHNRWR